MRESAEKLSDVWPAVLVIAGSDSAGIAGIQRDNQTIHALNCHALNIITANTAQNHEGVHAVYATNDHILKEQLRITQQRNISAIKIGLLASLHQIEILRDFLSSTDAKVILDPVIAASSGENFHIHPDREALVNAYQRLLPYCDLVTPNLDELHFLCGDDATDKEDKTRTEGNTANGKTREKKHSRHQNNIHEAAAFLLNLGAKNVLIKGGHLPTSIEPQKIQNADDYFANAQKSFWLRSPRQSTRNTRGTGCALASSIAAAIAQGYPMEDACVIGKMAINQGISNAYGLAEQAGPVFIHQFPAQQEHLPELITHTKLLAPNDHLSSQTSSHFEPSPPTLLPNGDDTPLGLYPIVDSAEWVARLLPLGVTTLQLRLKGLTHDELSQEIEKSVLLAREYNCRLFINDHWRLAIELGAYGVHLGQEDLDEADISAIKVAGLRLGISTHCHYEVARAHHYRPSYMACGPIYHTDTKQMPWIPHGLKGLAYWKNLLQYPLVAIGGINQSRITEVMAQSPDGIAMITAITLAQDPDATTQKLLQLMSAQIALTVS